jgi:hypothetical protein
MPQNATRSPLENHPEAVSTEEQSDQVDLTGAVRAPRGLLEWIADRVQPDLSRLILGSRTGGPAFVGAITTGRGHRSARPGPRWTLPLRFFGAFCQPRQTTARRGSKIVSVAGWRAESGSFSVRCLPNAYLGWSIPIRTASARLQAVDLIGAPGRTRTSTPLRATDFESAASTNSATGAPGRSAERATS